MIVKIALLLSSVVVISECQFGFGFPGAGPPLFYSQENSYRPQEQYTHHDFTYSKAPQNLQAGVNRPASTNFQPSYNSPISSAQYENQKLNSKISNRNQDKIPDTNPIIQEDKITQHYSTIEKGSIIQRIDNFPNGQYGSGGQLSSQNIPLNSPNRPLKYPNNGSPYNPQAGVNYQDNRNQNYNGGGLLNTSKRPSITDRPANEGIEPSRENVNQSPKNKQKYPTLNAPDRNRQDNAGTRPIPTSYEDSEPIREYQNQFNRNKLQTTNFPREPKPENFEPVTDFAWRFFKNANNRQKPNSVYCPLSPQLLLSYLAYAADGTTKQEIVNAIGYDSPDHLHYLKDQMLSNPGNKDLQLATAMFLAKNLSPNDRFTQFLQRDIELIKTDFRNPDAFSRDYSNWVAKKTKGQLQNIQATVEPSTKMIMTSAVYFKGEWIYKLIPVGSEEFTTDRRERVKVPMMKLLKKLQYGKIEGLAEWIALPYNSNDSMIIMLPNEGVDVNNVIDQMSIKEFTDSYNKDTYANVTMTLPKFKVETKSSIIKPLSNMGIQKVFSFNSELPHLLSSNEPVGVSQVLQQASLEVNEEGSIATSLTAVAVVALSFSPPTPDIEFTVNRPFIAMIYDRRLGFPYFISKISNPRLQ